MKNTRKVHKLDRDATHLLIGEDSDDNYSSIEKEHWDSRRWYEMYRVVFKYEGEFYEWFYDEPSTENQEWPELESEDLLAIQVFPVVKTVTVYE